MDELNNNMVDETSTEVNEQFGQAVEQPETVTPEVYTPDSQPADKSGMATASMVVGICAVVFGCCCTYLGIILGVIALVLGFISVNACEKKGVATAGIICGGVGILVGIIGIIIGIVSMKNGNNQIFNMLNELQNSGCISLFK